MLRKRNEIEYATYIEIKKNFKKNVYTRVDIYAILSQFTCGLMVINVW